MIRLQSPPMPAVAVVGASNDRARYANKAVRAFRSKGWTVYPVHPRETLVEGLPALRSIRDVPRPLDCVTLYVPPGAGALLLDDIAAAKPARLYVNPGAESPDLVAKAKALGLEPLLECSIRAIGADPNDF